jgi:hypothetical protein
MGNMSYEASASPQERHLLRELVAEATCIRVTITWTKLPIAEPKINERM